MKIECINAFNSPCDPKDEWRSVVKIIAETPFEEQWLDSVPWDKIKADVGSAYASSVHEHKLIRDCVELYWLADKDLTDKELADLSSSITLPVKEIK